ncbi:MAG: UDP-N-acetylmuramoylalanyl-D-glutamyl-2,6-diaminopimelate--D-alanyl-D-alanine ligase [Alphaproteobacteria bacterium]|nr:UDP-N-acetylmuramoylalanyl-D-glutamyl-2,6-diaminopimelate--D-alanyl-D-alanine ligase [Alphaproteobacteria bacterium]
MTLWAASEAAAATAGRATHPFVASGVSIDSRSVAAGDLFVALTGPKFDGHDFVAAAVRSGAAAAMVSRRPADATDATPLLVVGDTMRALYDLGAAARVRTQARVIGVTGSAGKTGTKEALKLALSESGPTHASTASFNNHWGVPLSLARMPPGSEYAVLEIGMNHAGEIRSLAKLARPRVAIITTVEAAHLEFFPSVEAIADAKAEILEGLEPGGVAILNRDNKYFGRLAAAARLQGVAVLSFGESPEADARMQRVALLDNCSTVSADVGGEAVTYKVGAPGRHWVLNTLAVLAAVHVLGADLGLAALAMARIDPGPGRGRRLRIPLAGGPFEVIDESYNANPASMRAALEVLGRAQVKGRGRRIAVLGDMRELGARSGSLHADLARVAEEIGVDLVYTVGEDIEELDAALPPARRGGHAAVPSEVAALLTEVVRPGDVVLVKGSQATGMAAVTRALSALAIANGDRQGRGAH